MWIVLVRVLDPSGAVQEGFDSPTPYGPFDNEIQAMMFAGKLFDRWMKETSTLEWSLANTLEVKCLGILHPDASRSEEDGNVKIMIPEGSSDRWKEWSEYWLDHR